MAYHKKIKFEMAVPIKRRDNIVSSNYMDFKPFLPSYEEKCDKTNFFYLMSMEYQRIWTREKEIYLRSLNFGPENISNWLRGQAVKHQHNIPRLKVSDRPPKQKMTKYDHVKSKIVTWNLSATGKFRIYL